MPSFNEIRNRSLVNCPAGWEVSPKFNAKERVVDENGNVPSSDYKGRCYRFIGKIEKDYSKLERFGRGLLGVAVAVARFLTCGRLVSSGTVDKLFNKEKKAQRFAVLLESDNEWIEMRRSVNRKMLENSFASKNVNLNQAEWESLEHAINERIELFTTEEVEAIVEMAEREKIALSLTNLFDVIEKKVNPEMAENVLSDKALIKRQGYGAVIEVIKNSENAVINSEMLTKLYDALEKEVNHDFAEAVLDNPEFIDIFVGGNRLAVTDEELDALVNFVKGRLSSSEDSKSEHSDHEGLNLEKMKESLIEKQDLPANIKVIKKAFPEVEAMLNTLPADHPVRGDFEMMIKKAMVLQSIKNVAKRTLDKDELSVYKLMGLDTDKLQNQEEYRKRIMESLQSNDFEKLNSDEIENAMLENQLRVKFSLAGGADEEKKFLIPLYKFRKEIKEAIKAGIPEVNKSIEKYPDLDKYPILRNFLMKFLNKNLLIWIERQTDGGMNKTYRDLKAALVNQPDLDIETFLSEQKKRLEIGCTTAIGRINTSCDEFLEEYQPWYKAWGNYLIQEIIQGSDDIGEVLGDGVCHAVTIRLCVAGQRNPGMLITDLASQVKIEPEDRVTQASYGLFKDKKILEFHRDPLIMCRDNNFSPEMLSRNGIIKATTLFVFEANTLDPEWFGEGAPEVLAGLKKSNGIFHLGISGHAIYMRVDHERKIYHFCDTNLGLAGNFPDLETMVKSFNDLMENRYPNNEHMVASTFALQ